MKFPAYPKYKASGVEWLGDVPVHWEVIRLRRVLAASLQYGANESAELDDPDLPRYVRITDVHENGSLRDETFRSLPTAVAAPYLLDDGDLLFARSGATSGKTFLYQSSWGVCAYAGYLIRARMNTRKAFPAFIKYFTTSTNYWQWLSSIFIQSTIQNVSAEKYADLSLSLPPLDEQKAIAAFLDRETGRIDRLVAKKQQLIERLKEKRTALVSRTVTHGLPPAAARAAGFAENPLLKDSGVEWLGKIPAHWSVRRAKHICAAIIDCKNRTPDYFDDGEFYVVRTTDVKDGQLYLADALKTDLVNFKEWTLRGAPQKDDVLFTREAPAGEAALFDGESSICLGQRMMYFRANHSELSPRFLLYFIYGDAAKTYINAESGGSTVTHLRLGQVYNFPVIQPPVPEQLAIATFLDAETAKLDALVAMVETAIERLQEYRTALITAAVTGTIDVRNTVAESQDKQVSADAV
ncbi:MAG: restriction endonuclease subunit S [Blastocatellia bacterium]